MNNRLGVFFTCYTEEEAVKYSIDKLKEIYPDVPVYLVSDGGSDFSQIKEKYRDVETRLEKVRYAAPKFTLNKHFKSRKIYDDVAGTAAYVISKSYCEKLLQYPDRFSQALDQILFYKKSHGELYGNFLQIFPALAIPLDISLNQIDGAGRQSWFKIGLSGSSSKYFQD